MIWLNWAFFFQFLYVRIVTIHSKFIAHTLNLPILPPLKSSLTREQFKFVFLFAPVSIPKCYVSYLCLWLQVLTENGVLNYLHYADLKLKEEEVRGRRYLDTHKTDSLPKVVSQLFTMDLSPLLKKPVSFQLIDRCVQVLVVRFLDQILAEAPALIKANQIDSCLLHLLLFVFR